MRRAHRRRSGWNSGGTHGEGRRWIGAEWGRVWWGVSPLQPTRGLGERRELPQRGPPRPKTDFGIFWRPQSAHFCTYMTKSAGDNLHYRPLLQILGGACPPCPLVIACIRNVWSSEYRKSIQNKTSLRAATFIMWIMRITKLCIVRSRDVVGRITFLLLSDISPIPSLIFTGVKSGKFGFFLSRRNEAT